MPGPRVYGIDRRGRRLWLMVSSGDWDLLEEQAKRRYMSVSGLISQIAAEWCDAELVRHTRAGAHRDAQGREHEEADSL